MPRVAAQDTPRSQPATPCRAVTPDRLDRVVAAARKEPAIGADHRADRPLVGAHHANRELSGWAHATPALANARRRSSCKATKLRLRVASRPINTRSKPDIGCSSSTSLAASLSRRRVRLRITALPIFFVTVKPSRAGPRHGGPRNAGPRGPRPAGGHHRRRRAGHAAVQRRLGRRNPAWPIRRRGRRGPDAHRDPFHRRLGLAVAA